MSTNILEHMAAARGPFRPRTTEEFLALQIARKLNDLPGIPLYLKLVERHSRDALIEAFRAAVSDGHTGDMAARFHKTLARHREEAA